MRLNTKPELSPKWWSAEKPAEIKGTELEKALQNAERALSDEKKKGDAASIEGCLSALEIVGKAVEKTINKECDPKKHKDAISVLKKFDDIIKAETKRLAEVQSKLSDENSEDEETNENKLFDKDYVCKMMQLMRSTGRELNFCFGLNTKTPADSQLLLCRKSKPEKLLRALKKTGEFNNRLLTYGTALPDSEDGQTLEFRLADSASEPPQILKLGREFLRSDKNLRFRKLKLVFPGGQTVEDMEADDENTDTAAGQSSNAQAQDDLNQELTTAKKLVTAWEETLKKVSDQIEKLREALQAQADPTLQNLSKGLGDVMNQFPDLDLSRLVDAAQANDRDAYNQTASQSAKEIRDVHELLAKGPLLSTIDQNPFVKTNVHTWVKAVLQRISDVLATAA